MDEREHVIVCGVDGSSGSQRALEWAIDESVRRGCSLRVVTAWFWDGVEALGAASSPAAALEGARKTQEAALSQALAGARSAPQVERVTPRATPSEALCSASLDAELLVLGSHGHGAVHDKLVGSTSQRTIHHASCPVVLLPEPRRVEKELARAKGRRHSAAAPSAASPS